MNVVLADRVKITLNEINDHYVIEHSADRAEKVLQSLYYAFDEIGKRPRAFPICLDIKEPRITFAR